MVRFYPNETIITYLHFGPLMTVSGRDDVIGGP